MYTSMCVYRVCGAKLYKKYQNLGTGMQLVCWGAGVEVTRGQTVMRAWVSVCVYCVCVREEDKTIACDYSTRLHDNDDYHRPLRRSHTAINIRGLKKKKIIQISTSRGDVKVKNVYSGKKLFFYSCSFIVFTTIYSFQIQWRA